MARSGESIDQPVLRQRVILGKVSVFLGCSDAKGNGDDGAQYDDYDGKVAGGDSSSKHDLEGTQDAPFICQGHQNA